VTFNGFNPKTRKNGAEHHLHFGFFASGFVVEPASRQGTALKSVSEIATNLTDWFCSVTVTSQRSPA
jgi:hypothetical protein